jgi:hypothetical protein
MTGPNIALDLPGMAAPSMAQRIKSAMATEAGQDAGHDS